MALVKMTQVTIAQVAKKVKMAHFQYQGLGMKVWIWENITSVRHFYLLSVCALITCAIITCAVIT